MDGARGAQRKGAAASIGTSGEGSATKGASGDGMRCHSVTTVVISARNTNQAAAAPAAHHDDHASHP